MSEFCDIELTSGQRHFMHLRALFVAFFGGVGCGKTWIGARRHLIKVLANPGALGCVAGGVYHTLSNMTIPTLLSAADDLGVRYAYGHDPMQTLGVRSRFKRHSNIITWENGAQDMVWSLAAGERLRGPQISYGWVDELRLGDKRCWDILLGRMRITPPDGQMTMIITTTPSGLDWMYSYFVREPQEDEKAEALGMPHKERHRDRVYAHGITLDNWTLDPNYVRTLQMSYDETFAKQELLGQFIDLGQGMAYYAFKREQNVAPTPDWRPAWWNDVPWLCVSCDFNVDPMAWIVLKHHQPSGEIFVMDELWRRNTNTPAHCAALADWYEAKGKGQHVHVYGDASGGARSTSGKSDYVLIRDAFPTWDQHVTRRNPFVKDRVAAVNGKCRAMDGKVRLTISPTCTNLIEDLELCQADETGCPVKYGDDGDFERKKRTHPSDALGYFVMTEYPSTVRRLTQ